MKNVILIHAHKNLALLNELIELLDDPCNVIYVNVDKKAEFSIDGICKTAHLIRRRVTVEWGRFSIVEATLNSLLEIEQKEKEYDRVIFISGQDYPLANNETIDRSILPGKEYIRIWTIGEKDWNVSDRFESYYFGEKRIQVLLAKLANQLFLKFMGQKRKIPMGFSQYGGSAWWILTRACVQYLLQFVRSNRRYLNFFRYVKCGDEIFFQTILMNSKFRDSIVNTNFHYMDWCVGENGPASSPKVLTMEDYEKIISSGNLFCRKVDLPESRQLMDAIKEKITSLN